MKHTSWAPVEIPMMRLPVAVMLCALSRRVLSWWGMLLESSRSQDNLLLTVVQVPSLERRPASCPTQSFRAHIMSFLSNHFKDPLLNMMGKALPLSQWLENSPERFYTINTDTFDVYGLWKNGCDHEEDAESTSASWSWYLCCQTASQGTIVGYYYGVSGIRWRLSSK